MSATATVIAALPKIIAYVKTDLDKRYSLLEPWTIPLLEELPGVYDCAEFHAGGKEIIVHPYTSTKDNAICDGNTLVPEEILGIKTVIGALIHDPGYKHLEAFAKAMGWSVRKARKFWDTVYGNILLELARREPDPIKRKAGIAWAHTSYAGVRMFGGVAHAAYKLALILIICTACAGANGGCMGKVVDDDFDTPTYRQESSETTTEADVKADMARITNALEAIRQ